MTPSYPVSAGQSISDSVTSKPSQTQYEEASRYSLAYMNLPGADLFAVTDNSNPVHVFGYQDLRSVKAAAVGVISSDSPTHANDSVDADMFVVSHGLGDELAIANDLGRDVFGGAFMGVLSEIEDDPDLGGLFLAVVVRVGSMDRQGFHTAQRQFLDAFGASANPDHLARLVVSVKRHAD